MDQCTLFDIKPVVKDHDLIYSPSSYTGLSSFHKYWGKKPLESIAYLIKYLTTENDIVLDPFLGSGLISREVIDNNRKIIGIDINPISIDLANLYLKPPNPEEYKMALDRLSSKIKPLIEKTYVLGDGSIGSHYLWEVNSLKSIWKKDNGRKKEVFNPSKHDIDLFGKFEDYDSHNIRRATFFQNSRINSSNKLSINDLFTGRALHNIDLLIDEIKCFKDSIRKSMMLTLTSSSGQMSNMVFAISGRGKMNGAIKNRIEVGSWVIGFWRPPLHFEINVWNCFYNRASKFMKALKMLDYNSRPIIGNIADVISKNADAAFIVGNCMEELKNIKDESINLLLTDPPHSDRIPYLELSEIWNAILRHDVFFKQEIVVSNAKERRKTKEEYSNSMIQLMNEAKRIICKGGFLAVYFNARDSKSWDYLRPVENDKIIKYLGCFPMKYSAGSVVQDNRKGALKNDYILVYMKNDCRHDSYERIDKLREIPYWNNQFPKTGK